MKPVIMRDEARALSCQACINPASTASKRQAIKLAGENTSSRSARSGWSMGSPTLEERAVKAVRSDPPRLPERCLPALEAADHIRDHRLLLLEVITRIEARLAVRGGKCAHSLKRIDSITPWS